MFDLQQVSYSKLITICTIQRPGIIFMQFWKLIGNRLDF